MFWSKKKKPVPPVKPVDKAEPKLVVQEPKPLVELLWINVNPGRLANLRAATESLRISPPQFLGIDAKTQRIQVSVNVAGLRPVELSLLKLYHEE